uniref:Uncharacterized protein n=1 Tax=Arundo donax TaxID=35708 RepID=A0A0A9B6T4_ARUDO
MHLSLVFYFQLNSNLQLKNKIFHASAITTGAKHINVSIA